MKTIVLVLFCLSLSVASGAADTINPKDFVRLTDVIPAVQEVLIAAQKELADSNSWQLKTADFDFQTVTTSKMEAGITAFVISGDVRHEKDATEEIDYSYEVPSQKDVRTALVANPQVAKKLPVAKRPFSTSQNYETQVVDVYTGVKAIIDWFHNINHPTDPGTLSNALLAAILAGGKSMSEATILTTPTGIALHGDSYTVRIGFTVTNSADVGVEATKLVAASPTAKYTGSAPKCADGQAELRTAKLKMNRAGTGAGGPGTSGFRVLGWKPGFGLSGAKMHRTKKQSVPQVASLGR